MRGRARRHSLAMLVVAFGMVGAQVSAFLHLALVEHELCAEHGELVESHRWGAPPAGVAVRPGDGPRASESPPLGHGHDHCLAVVDRRTPPPPVRIAAVTAPMESRPVASPPRAIGAPRGPPLYRLAPKNSPPA